MLPDWFDNGLATPALLIVGNKSGRRTIAASVKRISAGKQALFAGTALWALPTKGAYHSFHVSRRIRAWW
jgi:hypothetical protein